MLKVGLTGGIGSGKTTAARIWEMLGIPVYYADAKAKHLMHENIALRKAIIDAFGAHVYPSGKLDRKALAQIVFQDTDALSLLNSLVHPVVRDDFKGWAEEQDAPYVIEESAILLETGLYKDFDIIVSVLCPMQERVERLLARDKTSVEQIQARIAAQVTDNIRREKSDYILKNGQEDLLLPQVVALDANLRLKK